MEISAEKAELMLARYATDKLRGSMRKELQEIRGLLETANLALGKDAHKRKGVIAERIEVSLEIVEKMLADNFGA